MRSYRFASGAAELRAASLCLALVSLTSSVVGPAFAASAKKAPMQVPGYTKLLDGAGPATNDNSGQSAQSTSNKTANAPAKPIDLTPVTLDDSTVNQGGNQTSEGDKVALSASGATTPGVLKATVETQGIAPKPPNSDGAMDVTSIKDGKVGNKIVNQAKKVNAMPVPLMETPEEAAKRTDAQRENEKIQIAELWDEALKRSPEIQFVVQKLMPTSDHGKAATTMMGMLSTAMYGAIGTINMMAPNMGTYMMTGAGANMIQSVLGQAQGKYAKMAKLSETEQIMLFQIIRNTADKLVDTYRHYKEYSNGLDTAQTDLYDLKNMVAELAKGQDAVRQLEMQYVLKKQQRDIDMLVEDQKRCRQQLIDISGPEAVDKLDQEMIAERSGADTAVASANTKTKTPAADDTTQTKAQTVAGKAASDKPM